MFNPDCPDCTITPCESNDFTYNLLPTPSPTPSLTPSPTPSVTPTNTPTLTQTNTNTPTMSQTQTQTATSTQTPTGTPTQTPTSPVCIITGTLPVTSIGSSTSGTVTLGGNGYITLEAFGGATPGGFTTGTLQINFATYQVNASQYLMDYVLIYLPAGTYSYTLTRNGAGTSGNYTTIRCGDNVPPSQTPTSSQTPTVTPTLTPTPTLTSTPTLTPTLTQTPTLTPSQTLTPTPTLTLTNTSVGTYYAYLVIFTTS